MLIQKLNNAKGIQTIGRGLSRAQVELLCENNSAIYNGIISDAFNGRNASCHIGPSTFWVYADTLNDVQKVKLQAAKYGYKNIKTIIPHATDENDSRIADPKGAYAVDVSESTSLIIGDTAKKLENFLAPIIEETKEFIIHTYGHMGRMAFKVSNEKVAHLLKGSLAAFFSVGAEKVALNYSLDVNPESLDCWVVDLSVSSK